MKRFMLFFPYLMLAAVAGTIVAAHLPLGVPRAEPAGERTSQSMPQTTTHDRLVDVVCRMEVNAGWRITSEHGGRPYHFCTEQCKARFDADPEHYLQARCLVCERSLADDRTFPATYLGHTYYLCSAQHRAEFKGDPAAYFMHTMWGIPSWLYYASIAIVLVVSFGVFEWLSRANPRVSATVATRAAGSGSRGDGPSINTQPTLRATVRAFDDPRHSCRLRPCFTHEAIVGHDERLVQCPPVSAGVVSPHLEPMKRLGGFAPEEGRSRETPEPPRGLKPAARRNRTGSSWRLLTLHPPAMVVRSATVVEMPVESFAQSRSDRFDLLSVRYIAAALRSRVFRFVLRTIVTASFLLIIAAGLFGNQNPALNIAPILTWTIWWGLLIVLILFAGKAWCYVCPWDAMAEWTEKLAFWRKNDDGLSANLKWPRVVRNILIATVLFVGLTWIELGFGVTMRPRVTAYLAIAMLLMAVASAMLFDRKSFCRYGCLVGRVSGLYALFAGVEVRARSAGTCTRCRTKECVRGSDTAYGCPTFLYPGRLETNTYCIQCMECVQACPHDNLAVNLRPWGSDLVTDGRPRTDEAYLALLLLAITGFHGLTMTPAWAQLVDALRGVSGGGRILGFSLGMALLMLGPIAVYAGLVGLSMLLGRGRSLTPLRYRDYFIRYAYALLPIALFYHIAHNMEHLLMEGPKVLAMASDPFGWGWNVFGTAGWVIPPMISLDKLWLIQAFLVLVGHVYSLWIAQKTSLRLFGHARAAFRSQLPMLAAMIAFSVFSLWLLKQPMEMRTSSM